MQIETYILENETPITSATMRLTQYPQMKRLAPLLWLLIGAIFDQVSAALHNLWLLRGAYNAGVLYGTIQNYFDQRGWIALLFIAIAVPMLTIWRGNHKIAGTWPKGWL